MKPVTVALLAALASCHAEVETPLVQTSSTADPGGNIVPITAEGSYGVPCLRITVGETVEWRNEAPAIAANVTSLGEPVELYSPSLVSPANEKEVDGHRVVWWRHTFTSPGVYEYYDTNQGDPGRKVVDPYYGTVTFVGVSDAVRTGVVCVEEPGSSACDGVCCIKASDCHPSDCCDLGQKRCLSTSPAAPVCEGKPAHREFACFDAGDCEGDARCVTPAHVCQ